ncbi:hypothetical protein P7K49_020307 [Saguinus oedipus]|uniref:RNA helicase n=1 Tax=Saguinus oedipus TaxID=9490 RepID=A0ABQ9V0J7_SAGOE|nr:hypothetical protein P7K49_020307 [Saguinus oedipus]
MMNSRLLTTQRVSCAHIYSALDPTARKINLAKFTLGKCSALIVTDLAARGLDIPLLDNVINYSFPAKGKLFLHRVGKQPGADSVAGRGASSRQTQNPCQCAWGSCRVARAGRSGTAYSLVAPDEIPYLLDLHLFLGRCLTLARPLEEPSAPACLPFLSVSAQALQASSVTSWPHSVSAHAWRQLESRHHSGKSGVGCKGTGRGFVGLRGSVPSLEVEASVGRHSGVAGVDGMLGRVPQSVVDEEDGGLQSTLEASLELRGLARVADNAQQQYVRSRPAPSPESIKRAKELDLAGLGLHPLFSSHFEEEELQRLRLVDSIKNYRSRARQKDRKAITRFQQGRREHQEGPVGPALSRPALQEKQPEEEKVEESVEDVFSEVLGRKRLRSGPDRGAKRQREAAWQRDQEFYIPYRPKDFDSERGLSVGGEGGAFEQQVAGAVLDLMGDEAQNLTRGRQQLKWVSEQVSRFPSLRAWGPSACANPLTATLPFETWTARERDRKKKRFVGQSGQEDKKKIKTESGRYISSSYKRDLYPEGRGRTASAAAEAPVKWGLGAGSVKRRKWKQKQKIDDRDSDEEGASDRRGPERRGGKRGRGQDSPILLSRPLMVTSTTSQALGSTMSLRHIVPNPFHFEDEAMGGPCLCRCTPRGWSPPPLGVSEPVCIRLGLFSVAPPPSSSPIYGNVSLSAWLGGAHPHLTSQPVFTWVKQQLLLQAVPRSASQPRAPGTPAGRIRPELKTKQQILKQRRRAQKLRFLQRGGLKQLSARNRRRAQELQQGAFGRGARCKKGKMRKRM